MTLDCSRHVLFHLERVVIHNELIWVILLSSLEVRLVIVPKLLFDLLLASYLSFNGDLVPLAIVIIDCFSRDPSKEVVHL